MKDSIKAGELVKELRLGNLVFDSLGNAHRVNGLDIMKMSEYGHDDGLSPIPLSKEVLEKCGFVKDGDYWKSIGFGYYRLHLDIDDTDYHVFIRQIDEPEYNRGNNVVLLQEPICHLHTLQNLYFALTRRELEITL